MQVAPRPLLMLHPDRVFRDRIRRISQDRFDLRVMHDWDGLQQAVQAAPPAAIVVVDPYTGANGAPGPAPQLRSLLRAFPSATVIAALDGTPGRYNDMWMLGTWGVAEIIQLDEESHPTALQRRLGSARARPLRSLFDGDLPCPLPGRARAILDAAVETVTHGGHPRDLAKQLYLSNSTLLRWCSRSQLPTPRRLLVWMRVLLAATLLDDPGHTVFSVALACGYSSDQALRRALKSVVPYTPTQLRERGAFKTVSEPFLEEIARHRAMANGS